MTISSQNESRRKCIADHLNKLIAICRDGHAGYVDAAKAAQGTELHELFSRLAAQRANFADELQQIVRALGREPRRSGSLAGAFHRGFLNIRSAMSANDPRTALTECERGEDAAVEAYRKVLEEAPLDNQLRTRISTQAIAVKDAHDEVRFLRDLPAYSHAG